MPAPGQRRWTDTTAEAALILTILFLLVISGAVGYAIGRGSDHGEGAGVAAAETGTTAATGGETQTGGDTTAAGETTGGETTAEGTTTAAETTGGGDADDGSAIFASAGCGTCHTLDAAGSSGTIGPNLDESQPSLELAVDRVTNGGNGMPPFGDQLSDGEIQAVAEFVSSSGG